MWRWSWIVQCLPFSANCRFFVLFSTPVDHERSFAFKGFPSSSGGELHQCLRLPAGLKMAITLTSEIFWKFIHFGKDRLLLLGSFDWAVHHHHKDIWPLRYLIKMTIVFMQLQSSKVSAVTFPSRQLSKDAVTFLSRKLWSGPEIRVKIGKYSSARLQIVV